MPNFCFGPRDEPMLEDHRPNVNTSSRFYQSGGNA